MRNRTLSLISMLSFALLFLTACATPPPPRARQRVRITPMTASTTQERALRPLWLVSNGWHTSIAIRTTDAPSFLQKKLRACHADHAVIGWGNGPFYMSTGVTPWLMARAVFFPAQAVLHVVPVHGPIERTFNHSDVLRFDLPPEQHRDVREFIAWSFTRDRIGRPAELKRGYTADSRFYDAREIFWFPNTCNNWVARVLKRGGVQVSPLLANPPRSLIWMVEDQSTRLGWRTTPQDEF